MLVKLKKKSTIDAKTSYLKKTVFIYKKMPGLIIRGVRRVPTTVTGRKSVRFRKTSSLDQTVNLNKSCLLSTDSLVFSIALSQKLRKLVSVLTTASGIYYALIASNQMKLFGYNSFSTFSRQRSYEGFSYRTFVGFLKTSSFVSYLELDFNTGAKYATANGVGAQILHHNFRSNLSLIQLPSGETKYFSVFAGASWGKNGYEQCRALSRGDKRLKRIRGFRAKVRGVAMNPIDHPHGGNTKAIRFPRTPWGLATKLK